MYVCCVCRAKVHSVEYTGVKPAVATADDSDSAAAAAANDDDDDDDDSHGDGDGGGGGGDDDDDAVLRGELLSEAEVTMLLQRLLSPDDDQLNLFSSCCCQPLAFTDCHVLDMLETASIDHDDHANDLSDYDDDDGRRQCEFVLNAQQFLASCCLSVGSHHRNMTVIRGENVMPVTTSVVALLRNGNKLPLNLKLHLSVQYVLC